MLTLGSQLDGSLCCYSCACIFSNSAIPTQHMLTEVTLLASLYYFEQCQNEAISLQLIGGLNQGV